MRIMRFLLFMLCLLLVDCAPQSVKFPNTATKNTVTVLPSPTVIQSPVALFLPSETPTAETTPTSTATSIVPQLAITLTPFISSSWVARLFEKPMCKFPCWWNIIPGTTTWKDAENLILFLGLKSKTKVWPEYTSHDVALTTAESVYNMRMKIFEKDGVVEYIALQSFLQYADFRKLYSAYEPKDILQSYGIPSKVLVFASLLGHGSYQVLLFYDAQGFLISYGGRLQSITNSRDAVACPDFSKGNIEGTGIYLQAENIKDTIENFPDEELQGGFRVSGSYMRGLEYATGLTIQEFSDLFVGENPSYCFTILNPGK